MMRRTVRVLPAGPKLVLDALGSRLMRDFVIAGVIYYALLLIANVIEGGALIPSMVPILAQGFVTAESIILYQRRKSTNLRHLSLYCLIGMIVMLLLCLFLGAVVLALNMEYKARTEEIMQLWTEANVANSMPSMIATVAAAGLNGIEMLFLWKALGMCAGLLEGGSEMKNWFLPAAVFAGLNTAAILILTLLQPGSVFGAAAALVSVVRDGLLTALLIQAARQYSARIR